MEATRHEALAQPQWGVLVVLAGAAQKAATRPALHSRDNTSLAVGRWGWVSTIGQLQKNECTPQRNGELGKIQGKKAVGCHKAAGLLKTPILDLGEPQKLSVKKKHTSPTDL